MAIVLSAALLICAGCGNRSSDKNEDDHEVTPDSGNTKVTAAQQEQPSAGETTTIPGVETNPFEGDAPDAKPHGGQNSSSGDGFGKNDGSASDVQTTAPTQPAEPTTSATVVPSGSEPTQTTSPEPVTPPETEPVEPSVPAEDDCTYEQYNAMSPEEQVTFFNQFDSMEAFVAWYNAAKDAYEQEHGAIDIGDGVIDVGEIIGQ